MHMRFMVRLIIVVIAASLFAGCASIVNKASQHLADNLTAGILDQDDVATAQEGIPAWLLLIDGLIQGNPQDVGLLTAGARLYSAYSGGFLTDPPRAQHMSTHGFEYARRATCIDLPALCKQIYAPFEAFQIEVAKTRSSDVALLYVLATLRPASLGGKPEEGKADFEKALALSGGQNQMVRVLYARHYARLVFDKDLHDKLLNEAIAADPHAPGLTLINVLAQAQARQLLESGKDYF